MDKRAKVRGGETRERQCGEGLDDNTNDFTIMLMLIAMIKSSDYDCL